MTNTIETPVQLPIEAPERIVETPSWTGDSAVESPLEELQFVWALESDIPGRLCVLNKHSLRQCFIQVFRSEQDAIDELRNVNWSCDTSGFKPIELSLESVIQQSLEQGPDADGYPCVGYVWLPEEQLVYTNSEVESEVRRG